MKKITILLTFIILNSQLLTVSAQNPEIDSLKNLLQKHTKEDTIRVNLLNETAYRFYSINIDKLLKYAEEAGELADKLNFTKGKAESLHRIGIFHFNKSNYPEAIECFQKSSKIWEELGDKKGISYCLINLGSIHSIQGNYPQSLKYYQKAMKILEELGNKQGISYCLNNIGIIHSIQGNYPQSLEYYQKAMKILEELRDKQGISLCLNNIGEIYKGQGNYPQALEYYQKSLKIKEELGDNKPGISICLNNIGEIHKEQGNYPQALEYYQKSLKIKEELGEKQGISYCLNNIGEIHKEQGNYLQALEYYQKSLKIREEIGDKNGICESYYNFGAVYLKTKKYAKALDYTIKSLKIANELELLNNQKDIRRQLSEIYAGIKNYQKAYKNYVLYKELNDSIFNKENIKKITGLEYQYEYEKEKQAIELEQQKKDAINAGEVKRQKTVRNSFIAGFILMLVLVLVVLSNFLQKRKANRILTEQKQKIEETNEELSQQKEEIQTQAKELETANKKLKELNATKDKFYSIIAHDLKSPFNTMLGFSELLIENFDKYDSQKKKKFIGIIQKGVQNTYKLLGNLLLWSRSQRGIIDFKPENLNLYLLIGETIEILRQSVANKSITLINQIPEDIFFKADRNMLSTIIRNLISNAIKFTHKGGEITIKAHTITDENNHKFIEITVKDSGVGISPEKQTKLFKMTEDISTKGTENEAGTGLGLILCKEFVEKHGGKIWVESEVGKGSKFIITLKTVTL